MNVTELGVYILGATALALLSAAGIATGNVPVMFVAAGTAGVSYLAQVGTTIYVQEPDNRWAPIAQLVGLVGMGAAILLYALGLLLLL